MLTLQELKRMLDTLEEGRALLSVKHLKECGEPGRSCRICGEYFDGLAWYIRLLLESEDRLYLNKEWSERKKSISYSAVSEEWSAINDMEEPMLERLIRKESLKE